MNCSHCQGIEDLFDEKTVKNELAHYRKKGPDKTTRMMTDAMKSEGVAGLSLLDIGGGVGAIQHDLFAAGLQTATDVDASNAYITAAWNEAKRRGLADQITFKHGNFVDLAAQIPPADVVTLDRVICCYPDMVNLINLSAGRARKLYGLVYPRDSWWMKMGVRILNIYFRLKKSSFRTFVHPTQVVESLVSSHGFKRHYYQQTLVWQVVVYTR